MIFNRLLKATSKKTKFYFSNSVICPEQEPQNFDCQKIKKVESRVKKLEKYQKKLLILTFGGFLTNSIRSVYRSLTGPGASVVALKIVFEQNYVSSFRVDRCAKIMEIFKIFKKGQMHPPCDKYLGGR